MKIAIGNDHRGYQMKLNLMEHLRSLGHEIVDMGINSTNSSDHPIPAFDVAKKVASGDCERGVLICGSAVGMVIAANKVKGIRAFSPMSELQARMSVEHNDANVIAFAADFIGTGLARAILKVWLEAKPDPDERFIRRRKIISDYEKGMK